MFHGVLAEISPDGRYLAYQSDESGRYEVYVRPFPQVDRGRWQISTGGATRPVWARSGRELFYLDESGALTAVPVQTSGPTFIVGSPATVFDTKYVEPNPARHYDVSPDGQRFLMLKDSAAVDPNANAGQHGCRRALVRGVEGEGARREAVNEPSRDDASSWPGRA